MKRFLKCLLFLSLSATLCMSTLGCTNNENQTEPSDTEKPTEPTTTSGFEYENTTFSKKEALISAPKRDGASKFNPVYSLAFSKDEQLSHNFAIELKLSINDENSSAGILFFAEKKADDSYSGYAFMISGSNVSLRKITASADGSCTTTEIGTRAIESLPEKTEARLRVERLDNTVRAYYMDDISKELVPWPEIETKKVSDRGATGVGIIDEGRGAEFGELQILEANKIFNQSLSNSGEQYQNPVYKEQNYADPQVIKWQGKYYCYSTSASTGFMVLESEDLVNWTNKGQCLNGAWNTSEHRFWAPEVVEHDGKFYMIFSNADILGIAIADTPLGPFVAAKEPLIRNAIDGHIFFDDDGRIYLYYVTWGSIYGIFGCELESDLSAVKSGTSKCLITPDRAWEKVGEPITEGPSVLKHNGTYYLTYSGSHYTNKAYAVGYATSSSPLGEYTRYSGSPILSYTDSVNGPGHHSFISSPDGSELFIVYHAHNSLKKFEGRWICIDRVRFAPTKSGIDRIEVYGPTASPQNYPS